MPDDWISFKAQGSTADIWILDEIGGWGLWDSEFLEEFRALDADEVIVHINSPGGDVSTGITIGNMLRFSPVRSVARIEGVAASIAALVAVAADRTEIADNASMFVHMPTGGVWGEADELRQRAEWLDSVAESIIGTFARKSGKTSDELRPLFEAGTWLNAQEAVELGFADGITEPVQMAASLTRGALTRIPEYAAGWFASTNTEKENMSDERKPDEAEGAESTEQAPGAADEGSDEWQEGFDAGKLAAEQTAKAELATEHAGAQAEWTSQLDAVNAELEQSRKDLKAKTALCETVTATVGKLSARVDAMTAGLGFQASGAGELTPPDSYWAGVDTLVSQGMEKDAAIDKVRKEWPELHKAMVAEANQ